VATLKQRLVDDMNEALKAREAGRQRLSAIRLLRAAVLNAEKAQGDLDDIGVLTVLAREAKRLEDSVAEYKSLGHADRAAQLAAELAIVRGYLPRPLGPDEVAVAVREAIEETGASGPADMGRVMKALMPRLQGRADGRQVSEEVKRLLTRP